MGHKEYTGCGAHLYVLTYNFSDIFVVTQLNSFNFNFLKKHLANLGLD